MGKKKFLTMVRVNNNSNADNVLKGIWGISKAVCNKGDKCYCHIVTDKNGDTLVITEHTKREYRRFCETVEEVYPGLCDFDI